MRKVEFLNLRKTEKQVKEELQELRDVEKHCKDRREYLKNLQALLVEQRLAEFERRFGKIGGNNNG